MTTMADFETMMAREASASIKPDRVEENFAPFAKWLKGRYTREQIASIGPDDAKKIARAWYGEHAKFHPELAREPTPGASTAEQDASAARKTTARAAARSKKLTW